MEVVKEPPDIAKAQGRVIVIEDDHRWRRVLSEAMNARGLTVDTASSVQEAIRLLQGSEYDLAVIDLHLSEDDTKETSGLRLAQFIRERNPESLLIVISGNIAVSN